ncbi:MAG: hypothetical protein GXP30_03915 [Verrucomicrobia bacterium]|nr:hypothetical protein [Verrucomicrobiota bacterium]
MARLRFKDSWDYDPLTDARADHPYQDRLIRLLRGRGMRVGRFAQPSGLPVSPAAAGSAA